MSYTEVILFKRALYARTSLMETRTQKNVGTASASISTENAVIIVTARLLDFPQRSESRVVNKIVVVFLCRLEVHVCVVAKRASKNLGYACVIFL